MRILLLGGGQQGRAVLYDLAQSPEVEAVTCVEINATPVKKYVDQFGAGKIQVISLDAEDTETLGKLMGTGYDVIIDMLPRQYARAIGEAAVEHGIHLVNTNYDHDLRDLAATAERAGVTVLPEMGMDPGIDLVLGGEAVRRFDTITKLMSYGGGFPEAAAVDNPLKYKITWTWEGVLNSYVRDARIIENGELVEIPHTDIFNL
ncbi:saccharopine dehydrogenase family protein, partial [Planctomycetota bacterium]